MAETVHLFLKANGADVKGESTQTSLGRADSIECLYYESGVETAREAGSAMATGRRVHQPLLIRKRIDKSTPLILKALCENQVIDGILKFYRPNPDGDGTTQQNFTVAFSKGRVNSSRLYVPDTSQVISSNLPPMEEVTFVFHTIVWTDVTTGAEHPDSWGEGARG